MLAKVLAINHGDPEFFRGFGCLAKKVLGSINDEMLTLVLELSDIALFQYCKKNYIVSIKCYYKHTND